MNNRLMGVSEMELIAAGAPTLAGQAHHYLQAASAFAEPLVINLSNGELDQI